MKIAIKILLWTIPFAFLIIATWHYYGLSGTLSLERVFSTPHSMIGDLVPSARVKIQNELPVIIDEPVYVDIRMPRYFNTVTLKLAYDAPEGTMVQLGAKLKSDDTITDAWKYDIRPLENNAATFDVSRLAILNHKIHIMISSPGLGASGKSITLRTLRVMFQGKSWYEKITELL